MNGPVNRPKRPLTRPLARYQTDRYTHGRAGNPSISSGADSAGVRPDEPSAGENFVNDIPTRLLGRTGLDVTVLGFGAMEIGGPPGGKDVSDADAGRLLHAVLDSGINLIDTAIDYGRSEELIGRHLAGRRHEYFLATKCGCVPGAAQGSEHVHTPQNIRAGVQHSLRTLRTDYLDIVQFHRSLLPDQFRDEGALDALVGLQQEGKVRFIGVSATLPNVNALIETNLFDVFQLPYSCLQTEHEEAMAAASAAGAGLIIRGGVARGAPTDWDSRPYYMVSTPTMREIWDRAGLDELLAGITRHEFMLRFTLSNPHLDSTIVGTANIEHLQQNVRFATNGPLPADVLVEARRRLAAATAGDSQ